MATVVLVGTLDTKGAEYAWLAERLREDGCEVVMVDAGVLPPPPGTPAADLGPEEVARAAGHDLAALRSAGDRGAAVTAMAQGAERLVGELYRSGRLHAVLAVAGSGGSSIAAARCRRCRSACPSCWCPPWRAGTWHRTWAAATSP